LTHATTPTELSTLSLHDALPISGARATARLRYGASQQPRVRGLHAAARTGWRGRRDRHRSLRKAHVDAIATNMMRGGRWKSVARSEEHTSELQSLTNLVCRLLLE